jgi:zinc/manganese transport system substrate-binding protein
VKKIVRALAATAGVAVAVAVSACGSTGDASDASPASASAGKLAVVATTTQVADFLRNIGGDKVSMTQILKPNVDAHDYEPTPADLQAISQASIVVKSGVGLEKWLDQTVESADFKGTVVDASSGVTLRKGDPDDAEMAQGDPHIWHNPLNAKVMAENIEKALVAADSADAASYQQNYRDYAAKLDKLDADITAKINTLPVDQRKLVTNHDAFGYYIERYRLEFVGSVIPSMDTSAELSASQLQQLVDKIKATGTKAIFTESSLPPKTAEAIAKQAGVKVEGGEDALYGDALGPAGSAGATYLDSEEHNTDTIVAALRG